MTTPAEELLSRLSGVKRSGRGWSARCPAHEDKRASLSVAEGGDGTALVKCHAGCTTAAVLAAVGLELRNLFPPGDRPPPHRNGKPAPGGPAFPTAREAVAALEKKLGRRSRLWTYHGADGEPVGVVVRWDGPEGKTVRPLARHAGGWRVGAMPAPRPLYRLPELAAARRVVVCEGEKAADAARSLGFTSTTSAGGAQAADRTDWRPLAGKEVWVLPDNDIPGRKYAAAVAGILAGLTPAPAVRVLDLARHAAELPAGGDLADVLADGRWCGLPLGDAAGPGDLAALLTQLAGEVEPWRAADDADAGAGVGDLSYRPFPVEALPEPVRGFVDAGARAIGCDPAFVALPLLAALASAVGNTRRLRLKRGWLAPPILWTAVVGESGTAKTPAFRLALRAVRERQQRALARHAEAERLYEAELAKWEKDLAAWKRGKAGGEPPPRPSPPAAERHVVSDVTVEALAPILLANPRGLLLARDELAAWIGSFDRYAGRGRAGADAANWLSMHCGESITVDRKTGTPRTIHVPAASVCVTGGIQPGALRRVLTAEFRENGLAARLLVAHPPRRVKRWTEADVDQSAEAELVRLFDRLYQLQPGVGDDGGPRPQLVRLAPDAKRLWVDFYNAHAGELAGEVGDLAAAFSKLEEAAARLALVVHCARWAAGGAADELELDAESMAAGVALAEWFRHEARRVCALLAESDADRDRRRLVEWIERKGGAVTPREVQRGCRWLRGPGAAEAALKELAKAGRGSWQDAPTATKGGRPARAFVLCRHVDASTKPTKDGTPCRRNPQNQRENGGFVDVDTADAAQSGGCVDGCADSLCPEAQPAGEDRAGRNAGGEPPGGPDAAKAPTPPPGAKLHFADGSWRPCGPGGASRWTWEGAGSWFDAADHPPPAGGG